MSLVEDDVFEWVDPPQDIQVIPSRFLYRWKHNQDGTPCRQKSRVAVQGFHKDDKATPVASQEYIHLLTVNAANDGLILTLRSRYYRPRGSVMIRTYTSSLPKDLNAKRNKKGKHGDWRCDCMAHVFPLVVLVRHDAHLLAGYCFYPLHR